MTTEAANLNPAEVVTPVETAPDAKATNQEAAQSGSILDGAIDTEKVAEDKRILEAKDEDLSDEEKAQKAELLKNKATLDSKAAKTVPEKYEVRVPDGMTLDTGLLEKVTPIFKELGISKEGAQKLVDIYAPYIKSQVEEGQKKFQTSQEENFKNFVEAEKKSTLDKLGSKANETLAFVAKFRDAHLSKETIEMLNATGLSNNFNFISDIAKFGQKISEDKLVNGSRRGAGSGKTDGEVLYGGESKE